MEQIAIIVAGGSGKRMNSDIPKQFLLLNGEPVLMRTINVFYQFNPEIVLITVLPSEQMKYWETLCSKHKFDIPHLVVPGGETRHHSVKNAVKKIKSESLVAIHDGVRPLLSKALIRTCFDTAAILGNAIPVTELSESIRQVEGDRNCRADRTKYRLVQTPQVFRSDQLIEAFSHGYNDDFTDEASLVEAAGYRVNLVKGQNENIKITTMLDMFYAASFLENC